MRTHSSPIGRPERRSLNNRQQVAARITVNGKPVLRILALAQAGQVDDTDGQRRRLVIIGQKVNISRQVLTARAFR